MTPAHILVVEDSEVVLFKLKAMLVRLGFNVTTYLNPLPALEWMGKEDVLPDLILSDVSMPEMDGYEFTRKIKGTPRTAQIPVVLLTSKAEVEDKIAGLQAGADDYLTKTVSPTELELRIKAILSRAQAAEFSISQVAARTISVFSMRGGAGVTSIAVNLSVALSQLWGIEVTLWDMALSGGYCAFFLNLKSANSLSKLANWPDSAVEDKTVASLMLRHESGIRLLPSINAPSEAELITTNTVDLVWPYLQNTSAYLVIDCGNHLTEPVLAIMERSDIILLVFPPELAGVKSATDVVKIAEQLGIESRKVFPILNHIFPGRGLPGAKISPLLGNRALIELPNETDLCVQAIDSGRPFVLTAPRSALSMAIITLAYKLSANEMEVNKKVRPSPLLEGIRRLVNTG